MKKISATIITYNEEKNIERCLKSLQNVADEIIIVDSFSIDNTLLICNKYNCKIFKNKFEGYGKQKQLATSYTTNDLVLSLDADEELSPSLIKSILEVKKNGSREYYSFNRLNFYCNQPIHFCGWYPDRQIRFFNKNFIDWNTNIVHETIEKTTNYNSEHLKGDLNHYTCETIEEHYQKEMKYAALGAEKIINKNKSISAITPHIRGGFKFFKTYILKLGILDGYYGYTISKTLMKSTFHKYSLARKRMRHK